jgi:hypothetical protein
LLGRLCVTFSFPTSVTTLLLGLVIFDQEKDE